MWEYTENIKNKADFFFGMTLKAIFFSRVLKKPFVSFSFLNNFVISLCCGSILDLFLLL